MEWSECVCVRVCECQCQCQSMKMCKDVYSNVYVHERENVRALEKTEYPFNIHSRLPLSDLAVKISFLSCLVLIEHKQKVDIYSPTRLRKKKLLRLYRICDKMKL